MPSAFRIRRVVGSHEERTAQVTSRHAQVTVMSKIQGIELACTGQTRSLGCSVSNCVQRSETCPCTTKKTLGPLTSAL